MTWGGWKKFYLHYSHHYNLKFISNNLYLIIYTNHEQFISYSIVPIAPIAQGHHYIGKQFISHV